MLLLTDGVLHGIIPIERIGIQNVFCFETDRR